MNGPAHDALITVVNQILLGREAEARALLDELVASSIAAADDDLQPCLFASALSKRLASETRASLNLYLQRFETPQISLFDLLARHLPTVALAGPLANEVLASFIGRHDEVTLLDVGIGSGRQEVALLRRLATQGQLPRRLRVIAVEPDADSLARAASALAEVAEATGLELTFDPVHRTIEGLGPDDWARFASFDAPLVVLSAFAVHHVRPGPARERLFHRLRELSPEVLVLCEPSSNHDAPSLRERFDASWRHFGLTFEIIDGLAASDEEKNAMKLFFAREIEDIVGGGDERCERHEPVHAWVQRLRAAGFSPVTDFGSVRGPASGPVRVRAREGYLGLDCGDETLVAVICATSDVRGSRSPRLEQRQRHV